MKFAAIALLASVVAADGHAMKADQSVATTLAWTSAIENTNDNQVTQLTANSNPSAPETPGVSGTITATTDADGAGSLAVDLTGMWTAKFQNTNAYDNLDASMGLWFTQTGSETTTAEDGTETTTETTAAEALVMTGARVRSETDLVAVAEQWDVSNAASFQWESTLAEWFGDNDDVARDIVTSWTVTDSGVVDNGATGTGKYWMGYTLSATRPFESTAGKVQFENKQTVQVLGGVWVNKNQFKEVNRGAMDYTIDIEVPPTPEPEPEPEPVDPVDTGATALSAAAAAVAVLALTF